ncbi:hypothetical protein JR334_01030 [Clostridia bacterium]|nr:hypothetical protein JR334_01030 [Clostridia bacterium]
MMKVVVAFYSHSGITRDVSEAIVDELKLATDWEVALCEIKPQKEVGQGFSKYLWGGYQVVSKRSPELMPYTFDTEADLVFIGTPVWASSIAPAIRSFFAKQDLTGKEVFCYYTCQGGPGKVAERFHEETKNCSQVEIKAFDKHEMDIENFEMVARKWVRTIVERKNK